jgi:hypothetical protein
MPSNTMLAKQGFKRSRPFMGDVFDNQYLSAHRLLLDDGHEVLLINGM